MAGCGTTNVKFQLRRDIEENWAGKTLLPGEPAFSTDTNGLKIGPGLWNDLSYIGGSGPSGPSGPSGADSIVSGPSGPSGPSGVSGPSGPSGVSILVNPLVQNPGSAIYVAISSMTAPSITAYTTSGTLASYGVSDGQQIIPVSVGGGLILGLSNLFPLYVGILTTTSILLRLTSGGTAIASLNPSAKSNGSITVPVLPSGGLVLNQPIVFQTQKTDAGTPGGTIVPGNIYYSYDVYTSTKTTIKVKLTPTASGNPSDIF